MLALFLADAVTMGYTLCVCSEGEDLYFGTNYNEAYEACFSVDEVNLYLYNDEEEDTIVDYALVAAGNGEDFLVNCKSGGWIDQWGTAYLT